MASCSIETVVDARRDLISELPANVKERILQRLPTRDAARIALLSTLNSVWKDAWLRLGQLVFDIDFFMGVEKCKGYSGLPFVKIITYILLQRVRPVKKFSLHINTLSFFDPMLEQSDLDQWFLFLSRNGVEELNISLPEPQYKLPFCIVSCPTIKQLRLGCFELDCPIINAPFIFPFVTSLDFSRVDFNRNRHGIVSSIPNLEKLDFTCCNGICNFKIHAPKLESLSIRSYTDKVEFRWLALHLKEIKVLCMDFSLLLWEDVEVPSFPTAINLQVIKLYSLEIANEKHLMGVLLLLQNSPSLCQLDITSMSSDDDIGAASILLNDPDSCIINQDTIKIELFRRSTAEMLFVKMLLLKSPALEKVVLKEYCIVKDDSKMIKILKELLCFPRASPKAQIVYLS